MFWRKKKAADIADELKKVTEVAGDQIAPGVGTLILVLGAAAMAGAGAYYVSRKRNKKAAGNPAALSKPEKTD